MKLRKRKRENGTEACSNGFSETKMCISEKQDSDARQFWQANRACTAFA